MNLRSQSSRGGYDKIRVVDTALLRLPQTVIRMEENQPVRNLCGGIHEACVRWVGERKDYDRAGNERWYG
jgi:hypothetical protein